MSTSPPRVPYQSKQPWYLRPRCAIWLGPPLIGACLALRFGWGGLAGPPGVFWIVAYFLGAAGILLTYVGLFGRR
jgi:hypothetical protein